MGVRSFRNISESFANARAILARILSSLVPIDVAEYIDPAAAATAGLEAATASQVAPRTVTTFVGAGVTALAAYPRQITFTTAGATASDAPATALITGKDIDGNAMTETVNVPQTATTATGTKCFSSISSVAYSAGDGTGATVAIGFAAGLGLPFKVKARAGGVALVKEIMDGAIPTAGALSSAATNPPYGLYTPNSAPNAARDYALYLERDID